MSVKNISIFENRYFTVLKCSTFQHRLMQLLHRYCKKKYTLEYNSADATFDNILYADSSIVDCRKLSDDISINNIRKIVEYITNSQKNNVLFKFANTGIIIKTTDALIVLDMLSEFLFTMSLDYVLYNGVNHIYNWSKSLTSIFTDPKYNSKKLTNLWRYFHRKCHSLRTTLIFTTDEIVYASNSSLSYNKFISSLLEIFELLTDISRYTTLTLTICDF